METVKTPATIDDLYRVPDDGYTYELVDGELVKMAPTGDDPNYVAGEVYASLRLYARRLGKGRARTDGVAYAVTAPIRRTFSPDVSFSFTRSGMRFLDGPPLFAAEVRSEHDYGPAANRAYAAKRHDYFAAGTAVVWDIDPIARTVTKYTADAPEMPTLFQEGEEADAEPALPSWKVAVAAFFPGARSESS